MTEVDYLRKILEHHRRLKMEGAVVPWPTTQQVVVSLPDYDYNDLTQVMDNVEEKKYVKYEESSPNGFIKLTFLGRYVAHTGQEIHPHMRITMYAAILSLLVTLLSFCGLGVRGSQ